MKKILIVDDEYLVCLGLKTTVNWEKSGFTIVGEARNGKEAIALFEKTDPDILLTDIKMPVMNGLELIKILTSRKPSLKVIILTHYDDFAYAQQAIRLGASQYIVKSELDENNILSLLGSLSINDEKEENTTNNLTNNILEYLQKAISAYHSNPEYPLPLPQQAWNNEIYLLIYCTCDTSLIVPETLSMLSKSFYNMVKNTWDNSYIVTVKEQNRLLSAVYLPFYNDINNLNSIKEQLRRILLNIRQYFDVEATAGISLPGDYRRLPEMFVESGYALSDCFFSMEVCSIYEPREKEPVKIPIINHELIEQMVYLRNFQRIESYINEVFSKLKEQRNIDILQSVYIDFLSYGKLISEKNGLFSNPALNERKFDYKTFNSLHNINEVTAYISDIYHSILDLIQGKIKGYSSIINKCIAFIYEHYKENISLSEAANKIDITKSYLSLLFKQETGINYSTYLTNYRIKQAKKLLKTTNYKIFEIADQVGFSNHYYFSKVFKDVTGLSCTEYKNLQEMAGSAGNIL